MTINISQITLMHFFFIHFSHQSCLSTLAFSCYEHFLNILLNSTFLFPHSVSSLNSKLLETVLLIKQSYKWPALLFPPKLIISSSPQLLVELLVRTSSKVQLSVPDTTPLQQDSRTVIEKKNFH